MAVRRPPLRRGPAPLPGWFLFGIVGTALIGGLVVGAFVFLAVRATLGRFDGPGAIDPPLLPDWLQPGPAGTPDPNATPGGPEWACDQSEQRVTLLVMGIDQRKGEAAGGGNYFRTDTMILLSIDPVAKNAAMLSIPRDLWVELPDFGGGINRYDRINTANVYGDVYDYPGGGAALAVRTTQLNLGIPVHYYLKLNFSAFEDFVDQLGGIDVVVPEDIYDPHYPSSDPRTPYDEEVFQIKAGPQHLDGPTALKYARTRHTPGSDFDRAKRQQQVLMAVRDRVTDLNMLPQLLIRVPDMVETFRDSVQTDLSINQLACLAQLAKEIPRDEIRSAVIDERYTTNYTTPDGAQVLVPDRAKLGELLRTLYSATAVTPEATATLDPASQVQAERARIAVENGTLTAGLAKQMGEYLEGLGLNVVVVANADRFDYPETLVIDYTGKPYTTRYLAELFNVRDGNILSGANPESPVDVKVILGTEHGR
jgi:LCP family protein required for cell wall assembly